LKELAAEAEAVEPVAEVPAVEPVAPPAVAAVPTPAPPATAGPTLSAPTPSPPTATRPVAARPYSQGLPRRHCRRPPRVLRPRPGPWRLAPTRRACRAAPQPGRGGRTAARRRARGERPRCRRRRRWPPGWRGGHRRRGAPTEDTRKRTERFRPGAVGDFGREAGRPGQGAGAGPWGRGPSLAAVGRRAGRRLRACPHGRGTPRLPSPSRAAPRTSR
jgi:hypothetical protein